MYQNNTCIRVLIELAGQQTEGNKRRFTSPVFFFFLLQMKYLQRSQLLNPILSLILN